MTRLLAGAVLAALSTGLAWDVAAQQANDPSIEFLGAIREQLDRARDEDGDLSEQLIACLPAQEAQEAPMVSIDVALGDDGKPAGPADLTWPPIDKASMTHLRQMLRLEAAVVECTPLIQSGRDLTNVRLSVSGVGDSVMIAGQSSLIAQVSTPEEEAALLLTRSERREIQGRLSSLGHDAGGTDGVLGPRSRAAISSWQTANELQATGYLNEPQIMALEEQSNVRYAEWQENRPKRVVRRAKQPQRFRGADGCWRYPNGRIIPKQSFRCDARGMFNL